MCRIFATKKYVIAIKEVIIPQQRILLKHYWVWLIFLTQVLEFYFQAFTNTLQHAT